MKQDIMVSIVTVCYNSEATVRDTIESVLNQTYTNIEYLIIDEFHHAVNEQYQRIVNYFKPQFMLGLTATPERMDGKNIYEICDYNVPYELSLKEAIKYKVEAFTGMIVATVNVNVIGVKL